jgi:MFS family permease
VRDEIRVSANLAEPGGAGEAHAAARARAITIGAVLRQRPFALYQGARVLSLLAVQMQGVAMAWQLYRITHDPLSLGLLGLSQFVPQISLSLVTGLVADRVDRRFILVCAHALVLASSLALLALFVSDVRAPWIVYAVSAAVGVARSFGGPAGQALAPTLVPRAMFPKAVALGSSAWQLALVVGPSAGGLLFAWTGGPRHVYVACALAMAVSTVLLVLIPKPADTAEPKALSVRAVFEGLSYVFSNKAVLGSISLDLFAVLLGGSVALLPAFAKDTLHAGPFAFGVLRSAPALGAATMALLLAYRPMRRRAGPRMLAAVFVFGIATIVFGRSTSIPLSVAALFVAGAADMISVVVRLTLVQLRTPDEMRGRVAAVNTVFIGASNELGEFESGVTAAWLGAVDAVVLGGLGTCLVVLLWALLFPALRRIDRAEENAVA